MTKQEILEEIRRTAKENGGKALGQVLFAKETGISYRDFGQFWARYSEAVTEAGYAANQLTIAYNDDFIFDRVISLMRKLGKFPTTGDFRFARRNDKGMPSLDVISRIGSPDTVAEKIIAYCSGKDGFGDVVDWCNEKLKKSSQRITATKDVAKDTYGTVYLYKHGRHYKIGKTNDMVRRGQELRIQLPEALKLIHEIKTDDPSGVENYWHKRFSSKRGQGEWFELSSSDITAFRRWRKIF